MAIKSIVGVKLDHSIERHYDFDQIWCTKRTAQDQLAFPF